MKYLVVLCDGMGDRPIPELDGRTAMEAAYKPNMDYFAAHGEVGICDTLNGCKPGSDIANMAVLGYDPKIYHTGRSPLEAASIGVPMTDADVCLRTNLVTLSDESDYEARTMVDYSAGEITTAEARQLIEAVDAELGTDVRRFYAGVSYRHCLLLRNRALDMTTTAPHDISLKKIAGHLPSDPELVMLMKESARILKNHPVNEARRAAGKHTADSVWFWGEGTRPRLDDFGAKYGVSAAMITAVDLLRGIGILAGMKIIDVPGATGNIDTNYLGKGRAAIDAFASGTDLVYIHVEAPDECGHRGEALNKAGAIADIDRFIVGPVTDWLAANGDFRLLVLPDHYTPVEIRTHSSEKVPYMIYDSTAPAASGVECFCEKEAAATGKYVGIGYTLMDGFVK